MSIGLLIALFFAALLLFFLALGYFTKGNGADLLDCDPIGRARARRAADAQDRAELLEMVNRDRREQGLSELTEAEVLRGLADD